MPNHNLFTLSAEGAVVPASSETILIAARHVLAHRVRRGASLQSPQKTGEYLTARLGHLDYEVFGLILLDLCAAPSYVGQEADLLRIAAFRLCPLHITSTGTEMLRCPMDHAPSRTKSAIESALLAI